MQVRKQQLELDMEQQTGSKQEKEYVKAVYCHLLEACGTYILNSTTDFWNWVFRDECVCVLNCSAMSNTCDPIGCSLPGSSVHGIFQAKNIGVGCHFLLLILAF